MSKRRDETEIFNYRLDALEKKIEKIEQMLTSKESGNINTELLNIVLSMVRPQQPMQVVQPAASSAVPAVASEPVGSDAASGPNCGNTFMFHRRKTMI